MPLPNTALTDTVDQYLNLEAYDSASRGPWTIGRGETEFDARRTIGTIDLEIRHHDPRQVAAVMHAIDLGLSLTSAEPAATPVITVANWDHEHLQTYVNNDGDLEEVDPDPECRNHVIEITDPLGIARALTEQHLTLTSITAQEATAS